MGYTGEKSRQRGRKVKFEINNNNQVYKRVAPNNNNNTKSRISQDRKLGSKKFRKREKW